MICGPLGALEAMREAHIPCYRTGQGYRTEAWYSARGSSEAQVPLRHIFALVLVAAILAIWAALAWNP
jgi:hypothetical protein